MIYVNGTTIKFSLRKGGGGLYIFFLNCRQIVLKKVTCKIKQNMHLLFTKEILLIKLRKNTDF
jgi:hypothetical protein